MLHAHMPRVQVPSAPHTAMHAYSRAIRPLNWLTTWCLCHLINTYKALDISLWDMSTSLNSLLYHYPINKITTNEIRKTVKALREVHFICINFVYNNSTFVLAKDTCVNSSTCIRLEDFQSFLLHFVQIL